MTETPSAPDINELTSKILVFELDLNKVFDARYEIIQRMEARTHTDQDISDYIVLSRRIISTVERKIRALEAIEDYYNQYEPENQKNNYGRSV